MTATFLVGWMDGIRMDGIQMDGIRMDGIRMDGIRMDGIHTLLCIHTTYTYVHYTHTGGGCVYQHIPIGTQPCGVCQ